MRGVSKKINLVEESHKALIELSEIRNAFHSGKIGIDQAKSSIGFFNATSRAITTAISAERWSEQSEKA